MKTLRSKIKYISSRLRRESHYEKKYSGLFDSKYYYKAYPDVKAAGIDAWSHYSKVGWKEGRNPSASFNTVSYLSCHVDVLGLNINPIQHYFQFNKRDSSIDYSVYPSQDYIHNIINDNNIPEDLYRFIDSYELLRESNLFDADHYLCQVGEVIIDPIEHYIRFGGSELVSPHADFDSEFYYNTYADVRRAAVDPLIHYLRHGKDEGRRRKVDDRDLLNVAKPDPRKQALQIDHNVRSACADIATRLERAPNPAPIGTGPLISILTPVYNVDPALLSEMVQSVLKQTYTNWQLCLVDDASTQVGLRDRLAEIANLDPRIHVSFRPNNGGISAATNQCLSMAQGEYVALVDNDDLITVDALAEMVKAIHDNDWPDWLYSDECKIDVNNNVSDLFAKPDWSPLLLINYMYTGHLTLYKKSLVEKIGGFRSEFDFSQDYDLALRIAENTTNIVHVEKYLYCWRMIPTSGSMGGKPTARLSNIAALQDAAVRRSLGGEAVALPTANRLKLPQTNELVSIVIPSDNIDNIRHSLNSIVSNSDYKNFEIIVVTNSRIVADMKSSFADSRVKWERYDKKFNFSDKCNAGVNASSGKYIIFFNDDVRVITKNWIEAIVECFSFASVGAVGPKLLYENGSIQHAGMVTGVRRLVGTAFHTYPENTGAHFNFAQCLREVSLICGALLAIPRDVFDKIGGFDAENTPINHSDVDLCFKVRELGLSCVYTPYASLFHIGHVSIGAEEVKAEKSSSKKNKEKIDTYLMSRWGEYVSRDPYFPPTIRDLVFVDSQEPFAFYPPRYEEINGKDILLISHDLSGSGAPKVVYDLACMLRQSGNRVVIASPADGYYRRRLNEEGFAVIVDPLIAIAHEASMAILQGFDVVIANTIVCWRAAYELSRNSDVYLYAHETELVSHFVSQDKEFADALSALKGVWCGSEQSAQYLRLAGIQPEIIEYGVEDLSVSSRERRVSIGLFGSYETRKAQDLAVLGFAEIEATIREQARLDIYGRTLDRPYMLDVTRLASGLDNVRLHGELDYDGYLEALMQCDIVLVCSRDDTLPLVSLDALALGKPLVCSRTTGTSRYLVNRESGMILEYNSISEIGNTLQLLISDSQLRQEIGKGARLVFERYFTRDAFARRLTSELKFTVGT